MRILDNTGLVQDPIHLGAVILDKLIGDLKSKLPFLNKKKKGGDEDADDEEIEGLDTATETEVGADIDEKTNVVSRKPKKSADADDDEASEEDSEENADNSLVGKLKAKLKALKKPKKSEDDDVDEATDVDGEAPKKSAKKKPNFVVIGGAALLIGFILFSDFGDETPPAQDPSAMLKPREKKQKPPEEKPAEKPTETPSTETAGTTTTETAPTEETPTETVTTTETTPTEATTTETTPTETVTTTETTPTETTPTEATTTEATPTETVTATETTPTETTPVEATPTETSPTVETPSETATADSVNGEQAPTSDDNLTEKILEDLENQAKESEPKTVNQEYVTPPNYENVGRGLVYNCTGKHWACIDGPSYKTCEDNSSGNKFLKKKVECYPFNVYETQSGCEKMQNRVVSSSAKTEFCSE